MNLKEIAKELAVTKLLGLGESSHGTHEFFEFKSNIFINLVVNHGFNTLLFEDSKQACAAVNRYISKGEGGLDDLMQRLYSVWRVQELKQFIVWLRENSEKHKVEFVGFDIVQTKQNLPRRDELMAKNIKEYIEHNPNVKAVVWAHNSHLQTLGSNFNQKPMGMFLKKDFGSEYVAIALLFGKGTVSATKLDFDAEPSRDRNLSEIEISSIPQEIAESTLENLGSKPYFLPGNELYKLNGKLKTVRSIGWGLVPELVNDVVEQTDIIKAFDGLVYFPRTKASLPIEI